MIKIGQVIRDVRKRKGLTQASLGEAAGLSTMSIRRYESGDRLIPEPTIKKISAALGEDIAEIFLAERKKEDDADTAKIADAINSYGRMRKLEEKYPLVLSFDFLHHPNTFDLLTAFNLLNDDGQQEAIRSVEIIAGNPIYQRTDPIETLPTDQQGKPSTTQKKPPEGQINPKDSK